MRDNLFRGKDLRSGEWVEGSYIEAQMNNGSVCHEIVPYEAGAAVVEVDPATIGQLLGLNDKNGVRIWEGDVVTYGDDGFLTAVVQFGKFNEYGRGTAPSCSYGWHLHAIQCQGEEHAVQQPLSEYEGVLTYWPAHVAETKAKIERLKVEVIGNVYDNPELLKDKK